MTSCRVVSPSLAAWKRALGVHVGLAVGVLLPISILFYKLPRRTQSPVAVAMGVMAAIAPPFSVAFGLVAIEAQENEKVHPWMSVFVFAMFGFTCFFRCMTVALRTYPEGAKDSLQTWLLWFTNLPEPLFVKGKLVRMKNGELTRHVLLILIKVLAMSTLLSIYLHHDSIYPLQDLLDDESGTTTITSYFMFLVDVWFHLWWIYLFASFCLDVGSVLVKLSSGYTTEPSFCNPLLASRCYREFWGTRWNRPVHLFLKRTIYIPIIRKDPSKKTLPTLLTFGGSGLLHEYNFYTHNHKAHKVGTAMRFFLVLGLCMAVETVAYQNFIKRYRPERIPSLVVAICLTIPLLPAFESRFFASWIQAGMLDSMRQLIPTLQCQ